jgi:hypothetical protein
MRNLVEVLVNCARELICEKPVASFHNEVARRTNSLGWREQVMDVQVDPVGIDSYSMLLNQSMADSMPAVSWIGAAG